MALHLAAAREPDSLPPAGPALPLAEGAFAAWVEASAADEEGRSRLVELLREDHPLYDGRGAGKVVRLRGWLLICLSRHPLAESALPFALEELESGSDPYLAAAAARALQACPSPRAAFAPFLWQALLNNRYRDEPISFAAYGESAVASGETSVLGEILAALAWLGPLAKPLLGEIAALRGAGVPKRLDARLQQLAIGIADGTEEAAAAGCCGLGSAFGGQLSWALGARRGAQDVAAVTFEDQDGAAAAFGEFFAGRPSIVVFFYTRCDNPLKCSLTVTKLARVQKLLQERGLGERIGSAAITYDPAFDRPEWLRQYGENRGLQFGEHHRVLRSIDGLPALRRHFGLGVNFVESLVNRHQLEVFVLDPAGRTAASFCRLQWDENEVVETAIALLGEQRAPAAVPAAAPVPVATPLPYASKAPLAIGSAASLALAFFPKCAFCWATYLSLFGIAGLSSIPYSPWLQPILVMLLLLHLAFGAVRAKATGRFAGFGLAAAGALALLASLVADTGLPLAGLGVALNLAGSLVGVFESRPRAHPSRGDRRLLQPIP